MSASGVVRATEDGVEIHVRLTPKSAHDRIDGVETRGEDPFLKVRVRAVPEGGKANIALEKLISDWLSLARGRVTLTAGQTARIKTIAISGDTVELTQSIESLIADLPA
jgi:uncharacterized protein YggU (UPF0235/DUF167 family)